MLTTLKTLRKNEDGATAIEYGLIAALIAVACITSFKNFGGGLDNMWGYVSDVSEDPSSR